MQQETNLFGDQLQNTPGYQLLGSNLSSFYDPQLKISGCILKNSSQHQINEYEKMICKDGVKIRIFLGNTGSGKSSTLKTITNQDEILVSDGRDSCTQKCNIYIKDGIKHIDTPGINDTNRIREEIIFEIVKFLFTEKIKIQQLFFVYVSNKQLQTQQKDINELVYTYFLYELFGDLISDPITLKRLIAEFQNSDNFLKWVQCKYHTGQDKYSDFRIQIYKEKDKALNYIQYANSYHIFVYTHFDRQPNITFKKRNEYMLDSLRKQIWSNITDSELSKLQKYADDIQQQEKSLNEKILRIVELAQSCFLYDNKQNVQNIILIGESQVGKSSLIEQLTKYKGLVGDSINSKSRFCEIFPVIYNNVRYNFIDTPGYGGTENRSSYLDNFKQIADFLRRNKILEFKILFVRNAEIQYRDNTDQIVKQFLLFISELFDQEVTLVDSDMLDDILTQGFNNDISQKNIRYVKSKMIQVERLTDNDRRGGIYFNNFELKSVEFKCNYMHEGELQKIDEQEDQLQIQTLFKAINSIDSFSVEDKIQLKITKFQDFQIITDPNEYKKQYQRIFILYRELDNITAQINEPQIPSQESQDQIAQKIGIQKELDALHFGLITNFNKIDEVQSVLQLLFNENFNILDKDQRERVIQQQNKLKNNIQRHFLILYQWNSYQFEKEPSSEKILLSRKQLHFWNLVYHLQPVIDIQKHRQTLEDLAKLKVIKEITAYQTIQNGIIDAFQYEDQEKINFTIQQFFEAMDKIIGVGGEGIRNMTYFSYNAKLLITSFKAIKEVNRILLALNVVASLASIGFDFSSYQKRYICSQQMQLNTVSNVLSGFLGIAAFLIPGIGWIVGGIAAAIGLIGNLFSQLSFTDKQQFDKTIGLFFKDFLNEKKISLLYFQKADLLKKKNCVELYSQPQCSKAYEWFRELEKDNFTSNKQILSNIHKGTQSDKQLKDEISQYIFKENIINKLFFQFDEVKSDQIQTQISEIKQCILINDQIIQTFFNRFKVEDQKIYEKIYSKLDYKKEVEIILKSENPTEKQLDHFNNCMKQYSIDLNNFVDKIKQTNYSYEEYIEFANGTLRKGNNFEILLNSYSNLAVEKQKYLSESEQSLITEIKLSQSNQNLFAIKEEFQNKNFFKLGKPIQALLDQISQLCNYETFISSRYLQKFKGREELNLSFCSQEDNLENNLEKSVDLLSFLKEKVSEEEFMQCVSKSFQQIDTATYTRIQSFYRAYQSIQAIFN
ncbi:50S ribosome-binding GTPase (macronuclear) [Tetrahymena thermophila SB210]|uniref:50S ribosome-binding GTPase n=1 Tax=Tetrahymena thermophila (strain SB210) TaxID=312017 RepID=Q23MM0_TETTS|nr:50S ribosome-binding GTPase [Tetrahymena thermophila SB210]EAR97746.2 50S ribosome-binding GTPase [Tetrahymena thermophila SB210]|eukprot:XP_001017991.2 50S ribosome-binding GTPase [Tetrahymena thermophila SB210]